DRFCGVAMMPFFEQAGIAAMLPEIFLALVAMVLLMLSVFQRRAGETVDIIAILALAVAAGLVITMPEGERTAFGGAFIVDNFARVMKALALFGSAGASTPFSHFLR